MDGRDVFHSTSEVLQGIEVIRIEASISSASVVVSSINEIKLSRLIVYNSNIPKLQHGLFWHCTFTLCSTLRNKTH